MGGFWHVDISPELKNIINIQNEKIENIDVNESIEFLLFKKLETSKASNLLIQGFNIKIPEENIKTYSGSFTFGALVEEKLAFEEKIDVKVDLLEPLSVIDVISSKISIFLIVSLLFAVTFFVFYVKIRKKRQI